jgi:hypothetical protein
MTIARAVRSLLIDQPGEVYPPICKDRIGSSLVSKAACLVVAWKRTAPIPQMSVASVRGPPSRCSGAIGSPHPLRPWIGQPGDTEDDHLDNPSDRHDVARIEVQVQEATPVQIGDCRAERRSHEIYIWQAESAMLGNDVAERGSGECFEDQDRFGVVEPFEVTGAVRVHEPFEQRPSQFRLARIPGHRHGRDGSPSLCNYRPTPRSRHRRRPGSGSREDVRVPGSRYQAFASRHDRRGLLGRVFD